MATQVPDNSVTWRRPRADDKYPWGQWFDGNTWALTPGVDFDEPIPQFRQLCYRAARIWEEKIRTKVRDGIFYLQMPHDPD